jgi:RNA polymerase sigma-70 factor (ECF subfamily)
LRRLRAAQSLEHLLAALQLQPSADGHRELQPSTDKVVEHPQDWQLVQRVLAGDEKEFARLFRENYPRLYRFAFSRLGRDADAADEMAQRTLCRAMRKLHLYRAEASLYTWLCRLCRNEIYDHLESLGRQGQRIVSIEDDDSLRTVLESLPADRASDPASTVRSREITRFVQLVLDFLPARYTDILKLKYVEDLGVEEIAGRLSLTTHAAESLLARARRSFREAWLRVTGESLSDFQPLESVP